MIGSQRVVALLVAALASSVVAFRPTLSYEAEMRNWARANASEGVWAESARLWYTDRAAWEVRFHEEVEKLRDLGVRLPALTVDKSAMNWASSLGCGPGFNGTSAALNAHNIVGCGSCPYLWGGEDINCCTSGTTGMDCSGLAQVSYLYIYPLERVTTEQVQQGNSVAGSCNPSNFGGGCAPGDLLFYCFGSGNDDPCPDHVVVYVVFGGCCECANQNEGCLCRACYGEAFQTSNRYC